MSWQSACLVFAVTSAGLLGGCISFVHLPLPPPSVPTVSEPDEDGLVTVEGSVTPHASVSVGNTRTQVTVDQQTEESGVYSILLEAKAGDALSLRQTLDGETSESTDVTVP